VPRPVRTAALRAFDALARPYFEAVHERVAGLEGKVDHVEKRLDSIHADNLAGTRELAQRSEQELARLAELAASLERLDLVDQLDGLEARLRHIEEDEQNNRRRLYELRESPDYELAFTEREPLVSYVIPTYDRFEKLRDVSLPSILGQTYPKIEVIVSGDSSPSETAAVIEGMGDDRVRFINRTVRGPYPDDPGVRWFVIGSSPHNDGVAAARGRWIATLGDDDSVASEHAEALLAAARENRWELCYGRHKVHYPDGERLEVGGFPPAKGEFVLQTTIYHSGLRFFGMEPADYLYEEPNDWALCRRMVTAGVRCGMVDQFLADKYENRYRSHSDWETKGIPRVE
jgi:Glycosyl transferase family 2